MISIIVNNENLDLYEENDVSIEWTSFVFSKTVKEAYSTDFTIPKTSTNIRLLGLYNLQDETPFDFQEDYIKGVLIVNEKPNTVNIQVISVSKDEVSIFLVESNPIADFLSKNLVKKFDGDEDGILIDTEDTIFPWWHDTTVNIPNKFVFYSYGHAFNPDYAQIHSSEKLTTILSNAMRPFGLRTVNLLKNTDRQLIDQLYLIGRLPVNAALWITIT